MAWDDTDAGDGTVTATEWNNMVDAIKNQHYAGAFTITGSGTHAVTGVGFQPSQLMFYTQSVGGQNVSAAGPTNGDTESNYAETSIGFAQSDGTQQVINVGASGDSVNAVSKYSSNSECVALRYAGPNGTIVTNGMLTASM